MKTEFMMMAHYNEWANERIYDAAAALDDAAYRSDLGAFFGSIHGTLNHLLLADRVWMHRFTGEGQTYTDLAATIHQRRKDLQKARKLEDRRIISYVGNLADPDLTGSFSYTTIVDPVEIEQPLGSALRHFFNHQTHHRGQVHALLTRLTGTAPSLDLITFQRISGA